jgi:hypothetical protein
MARLERIVEAGYYHIINRGVEQRNIFLSPDDFETFLDFVDKMIDKFNITL